MSESIGDALRHIGARMYETYPDPHGYPEELGEEADRAAELEAEVRGLQDTVTEQRNLLDFSENSDAVRKQQVKELERELDTLRPLAERGERLKEAILSGGVTVTRLRWWADGYANGPIERDLFARIAAALDAPQEADPDEQD